MKLGVLTVLYNERPLEEVARQVADLGYEAVELAAWRDSNHLDLDRVLTDGDYRRKLREMLARYELTISALANHLEGQLVLGPHDATTDVWAKEGTSPNEKIRYGTRRLQDTARAAALLGVPVVSGFTGSSVWGQWYIFPPDNEKAYEEGFELFAERWNPILDTFRQEGVRFALEVHPTEIAYNIETAQQALKAIDHRPEFGFNFDPSHMVWQSIDPVLFLREFHDRIYHVHAKDAEVQRSTVARSGVIPTGAWMRPDRGFRFRVPGWGQVNWREVMTALVEIGYDYVLSYEHEDPVMSRDDGLEKNIQFLRPLVIREPLKGGWW